MKYKISLILLAITVVTTSFVLYSKKKERIRVILIGDSTVKNGRDDGQNMGSKGQWGWGHYLGESFDTTKAEVINMALGGTSSRTFMTNPTCWEKTLPLIRKGDYVLMQFGHNDSGVPDEPTRARATLKGNGEEVQEIENPIRKVHETVHTYGWYIRSYISQIKAKGATPVVCSLIPRNNWRNGKVIRANEGYGLWAKEAAGQGGAYFIDLNQLIADKYDVEGPDSVKRYFWTDNLHTIEAGARMNALCVVDGIKHTHGLKLKKYLKK